MAGTIYIISFGVLSLSSIPCMGRYVNGTWKFWTIKSNDETS